MRLQGEGKAILSLRSPAGTPGGAGTFGMARVALAFIALAQVSATPGDEVGLPLLLLGTYVVYSVLLLAFNLRGRRAVRSPAWLAVDAAFLLAAALPLGEASRVPLVALGTLMLVALRPLFGLRAVFVILATCAAVAYARAAQHAPMPVLAWHGYLPYGLLLTGSLASVWWRSDEQRNELGSFRAQLLERCDPRTGLGRHVAVLLQLIGDRFHADTAVLSLQGPEPRVFVWTALQGEHVADDVVAQRQRDLFELLPKEAGCLRTVQGDRVRLAAVDLAQGLRQPLSPPARDALAGLHGQCLALPLRSYGRPSGHLLLSRAGPAFDPEDLAFLDGAMLHAIPLLERADLLEQLQGETAAHERARIGRDLHDSAVQPYLGIKYALEALTRRVAPDNPALPHLEYLVGVANDELAALRKVATGLRAGRDPAAGDAVVATDALSRHVQRFEALFGLRVSVQATGTIQMPAAMSAAVLHLLNEALTNIRQHTAASSVSIVVEAQNRALRLRLRNDWGPRGRAPAAGPFVPRSLTERAAEFGGAVHIVDRDESTEMTIVLPLAAEGRAARA